MSVNACRKGKAGERELAHELKRLFGVQARRTQQHCGDAGDSDVTGIPGVFIECKRVQSLNVGAAMEKAIEQCPDNEVPIVCHRRNGRPWLVTLSLDDLPKLSILLADKQPN